MTKEIFGDGEDGELTLLDVNRLIRGNVLIGFEFTVQMDGEKTVVIRKGDESKLPIHFTLDNNDQLEELVVLLSVALERRPN